MTFKLNKTKKEPGSALFSVSLWTAYIMPPIPPIPPIGSPAGIGGSGSGLSATRASVVSNKLAIEAAFGELLLSLLQGL